MQRKAAEMASRETPMTCALCNKSYPWTEDYWPSLTYAECFRCWRKGCDEQVRAAQRAKWLYEHQWLLAPLGAALGALVTWMVMR
jgi:hypothetical protein